MPEVELVPITKDNVRAVLALRVKPSQERFVAPNAVSIAEWATANDASHWAIAANDVTVGYVLLSTRLRMEPGGLVSAREPIRPDLDRQTLRCRSKQEDSRRSRPPIRPGPEYYLWRFMIADRFQGRGFGDAAMVRLIDHVRTLSGADRLFLSYVPRTGGPGPFYGRHGFIDTGRIDHGEVEAVLELPPLDTVP